MKTCSSLTVARLLQLFRSGSTTPAVVETHTGARFLLKFAAAGPGVRGLLTEFLATRIAGALGLRVPPVRAMWLPPGFPWQIGTDEFDDLVQRSAGWNLGISMIDGARPLAADELAALPAPFVRRLVVAGRLLQNVDRSLRNPNVLADATGELWAIDFGACLFLDRVLRGAVPSFGLVPDHMLRDTDVSPLAAAVVVRRLPDVETLSDWLAEVPDEWLAGVPLPRDVLAQAVVDYLAVGVRALETSP